jgi:hypothetical protein
LGFDDTAAKELSISYPEERIRRQCEWFQFRTMDRNPLGALRSSIVEDWGDPQKGKISESRLEAVQQEQTSYYKKIENCLLCDSSGNRLILSEKYPRGAVKKCTHDLSIESKFTSYETSANLRPPLNESISINDENRQQGSNTGR